MMPQSQATKTQSQVNNATVGSGTRNDHQTTVTLNVLDQESNQQSNYKGNLWIDSGTNVSAIGRFFKMIEETGRFANMTGFANDLAKNNVPIGSGLTCCVNKLNAGIWLADVFCCHGGDQRLVAPVENSEEMLDMDLE
eukprot:12877801-Ditylum_brightwellii.AAC.1